MKIGFLGTAGAITSSRRRNTSLLFTTGSTLLLAECGGNPVPPVAHLGHDWRRIEHVLLSHRHTDHLAGLPSLLHQLQVTLRDSGSVLNIWGPEGALDAVEALLLAVNLWGRKAGPEIQLRVLPREVSTLTAGDLTVTTFPVSHGLVPTLGARIQSPTATVVYSADTEPTHAVLEHCEGADLLIHECSFLGHESREGHTNLAQIEEIAQKVKVPRIRLVHLPPSTLAEEKVARKRLDELFEGRVRLAEDLDEEHLFSVP
jgi:ribonuclease BN (tRNA processing enzyme)